MYLILAEADVVRLVCLNTVRRVNLLAIEN